jgi:hypothetical protein
MQAGPGPRGLTKPQASPRLVGLAQGSASAGGRRADLRTTRQIDNLETPNFIALISVSELQCRS